MNSTNFRSWIHAARLRTLPLATAGSLMGSFLALEAGTFRWSVFALALITALLLQILSNFANDLGDSMNGADNEMRVGPKRTVQSGKISIKQMKSAVVVMAAVTFLSGLSLLHVGVGLQKMGIWLFFLALGVVSLGAAIFYTAGPKPYGYMGLGDLFVFLFFGLVAVAGTYFLHAKHFETAVLLPAVAIGFLSTAVLNLNNLRDVEGDRLSGKHTIAVLFGSRRAKLYHALLVIGALVLMALWCVLFGSGWGGWLFLLAAPLLIRHLAIVFRNRVPAQLDSQMKVLSLSTLLLVLLFGVGVIFLS